LVARRKHGATAVLGLLGLSMGALLVCKTHFFLCIAAPIVAMLLIEFVAGSEFRRRWPIKVSLLSAPALVLGSIHLYTVWGVTNYFGPPAEHGETLAFWSGGLWRALWKALEDYYAGTTHDSFWGIFGWLDTPLQIGSADLTGCIGLVIQGVGLLLLLLTLARLEQVGSRLAALIPRRRRLAALRIALSNPVLNSYFAFTLLMIVLHVWLDNRFGAQGRNWIPFMLPFLLSAVVYAPRALSWRPARSYCSLAVLAGLLVFVGLASYYGPRTLRQRFYGPLHGQEVVSRALEPKLIAASAMTWSGSSGQSLGIDPQLVFSIPKQFVHAVQIRFRLSECQPQDIFQAFWARSGENAFCESERTARYLLREGQHSIAIGINDTIDHLRIDPAAASCRIEIEEICLLQPRDAAAARR
jgi:hypothetical protein